MTVAGPESVNASFAPAPQLITLSFAPGTTVTGMATYDCPSNPNPSPRKSLSRSECALFGALGADGYHAVYVDGASNGSSAIRCGWNLPEWRYPDAGF